MYGLGICTSVSRGARGSDMPYKLQEDRAQWRRDYKQTPKGRAYSLRQWQVQEAKRRAERYVKRLVVQTKGGAAQTHARPD